MGKRKVGEVVFFTHTLERLWQGRRDQKDQTQLGDVVEIGVVVVNQPNGVVVVADEDDDVGNEAASWP